MNTIIEEKAVELIKGLLVIVVGLVCVLIFIIYPGSKEEEQELENQFFEELLVEQEPEEHPVESADSASIEFVESTVIIDVKGAVEMPGVYEMDPGSRVIDCIERAGGFLMDAEQKSVNLAQCAEDQMVIYIPMKGEDLSEIEQLLPDQPVSQTASGTAKIDLNKASKDELMSLNGIGATKAEGIISYRETNGAFQKVEDLTNVSGIGEATFEKIKETIQVVP